jgi:hypothetical protein
MTSNQNCGACGNACPAGSVCSMGQCSLSCQQGLTNCNGKCSDLQQDDANCGACGTACGAGTVCSGGTCVATCGAGLALCNGACTNLSTSNQNCGACGNACGAGSACQGGVCQIICPVGQTNCNGTCVDLQTNAQNCGACGVACGSGQVCSAGTCQSTIKVAVMGGSFYTDTLRAYLATQPGISSATQISDCTLNTLNQYKVVLLYGNMTCFDATAFTSYVQAGGGIVATPWIHANNGGFAALPVTGTAVATNFNVPLNVTVTDPNDVLLQGVSFVNGDSVGWEDWNFTLRPGATSSVLWNNTAGKYAVAKWSYGSGRSVYLDLHYITSDCSLAIQYNWGKQLVYNATLWAGKLK